jgi:hypothetical protein
MPISSRRGLLPRLPSAINAYAADNGSSWFIVKSVSAPWLGLFAIANLPRVPYTYDLGWRPFLLSKKYKIRRDRKMGFRHISRLDTEPGFAKAHQFSLHPDQHYSH